MEVRQYFKKINEIEETIPDQYPLIVSLDTPDGGKPGTMVEVSRREAAKAIVNNRAVLASEGQKKAYYEREASKRKLAEKAELSRRLQIAFVSDSELRNMTATTEKAEEPKGSR